MPNTISSAVVNGVMGDHAAIQPLAYQRLLLAGLGITPWISQNVAYVTFDSEAIFNQTSSSQNHETQSQTFVPHLQIASIQSSNLIQSDSNNLGVDNLNDSDNGLDDLIKDASKSSQLSDISFATAAEVAKPSSPSGCRYHIQAIVLSHWIFIADEYILQQDSRLVELWHNIGQSMAGKFLRLQFPLVHESHNAPLLSQNKADSHAMSQLFANEVAGLASFSGFIHAHLRATMQVGYLTPLPPILLRYPMQALPTLSQMLENPSLKRELWQIMKNPPSQML